MPRLRNDSVRLNSRLAISRALSASEVGLGHGQIGPGLGHGLDVLVVVQFGHHLAPPDRIGNIHQTRSTRPLTLGATTNSASASNSPLKVRLRVMGPRSMGATSTGAGRAAGPCAAGSVPILQNA
jgi:hypothetical protein